MNLLLYYSCLKSFEFIKYYFLVIILILASYYLRIYNVGLYALMALFTLRGRLPVKYILLGGFFLLILFYFHSPQYFARAIVFMDPSILNPIKYILTPIPWKLSVEYNFLLIPSIIFLITSPLITWGVIYTLKNRNYKLDLLNLWCVVNIIFYSLFPMFLGPRQKLQVSFALIIYLIYGIKLCIYFLKKRASYGTA